jgi:peptidoglycan hydrolase CwlO-like protein
MKKYGISHLAPDQINEKEKLLKALEEKKRIQGQIEALNKNISVMKIKDRKKRKKVTKEENEKLL